MINTNNNINFTARLNLSNVKSNKTLLKNVDKIFQEKTAKSPYTFALDDSYNILSIDAHSMSKFDTDLEHSCTLTKEATKKLLSMPAEKIAAKFVKLLNVFKKQDETVNTGLECLNKLDRKDKYKTLFDTYDSDNSIFDRIWSSINDKIVYDRVAATSKDNIFRTADFID